MAGTKSERSKAGNGPIDSLLEWIAAGIGLILTIGIVAVIGSEAISGPNDQPPALVAAIDQIVATPAGYVVELTVSNSSRATGAAVLIEGELSRGGQRVERSQASISYVPGESRRRAGLVFTRDPAEHQISVRVIGYEAP